MPELVCRRLLNKNKTALNGVLLGLSITHEGIRCHDEPLMKSDVLKL